MPDAPSTEMTLSLDDPDHRTDELIVPETARRGLIAPRTVQEHNRPSESPG
jgi:hypothetical protein